MKYLINFCLFICFTSCSLPTTKGFIETSVSITEYQNLYFSNPTEDYVYKAKIKAFNKNFGGLLIVKKIATKNHRIVFTTEFGNKIFDFEINNGKTTTHFILEQLNKGVIIKTLQRDFETLTKEYNTVQKTFKSNNFIIYKSKLKSRYNYYFIDKTTKELDKIVHATKTKEKTIFSFNKATKNKALKINIQHKNLPIIIDLTILKSF